MALVQMTLTPNSEENLARAIARVEQAADAGAEVICLPVLFRTQYICQREDTALLRPGRAGARPHHRGPGEDRAEGPCRGDCAGLRTPGRRHLSQQRRGH